jgi:hypothetical protein
MGSGGGAGDGEIDRRAPVPARDLIDFFQRWGEFRGIAGELAKRPDLSAAERDVLHWMLLLIDRVGRADVGS